MPWPMRGMKPLEEEEDELAGLMDLEREAIEQGALGSNLPLGTKVEFAPDSAMQPESAAERMPIVPKVVQVPGGMDDVELAAAQLEDRRARAREAFERGGRQMVAGLTRTQEQPIFQQGKDAVARLLAKRKEAAAQAQLAEQNRLGAAKLNYDKEQDRRRTETHATERAQDLEEREKDNARAEKGQMVTQDLARSNYALAAGAAGRAAAVEERAAKAEVPKAAAELRKEYNALPDVKTFGEVDAAYQKVKAAASSPSAAGDLSAIFAYMKMLDPGSSVREGEFANAQNAGGIDAKITAAYNNVLNGQRLTPAQRADFIKQAENLYGVHKQRRDAQAKRYGDLASKQGLAPEDVTGMGRPSNGGRVIVSDGKKTLEIDAADLEDAERDGFKRVR